LLTRGPPFAVAQFANRSPFPMIHLLRQESVTDAVDEHPNSVAIAQANARLLRGLGTERLEEMVEACTLGTGATSGEDVDDTPPRDTGLATAPSAVRGARAARLFDALDSPSG